MAAIRAEPVPLRAHMRPGVAEDMQAILGGLAGPDDTAQPRFGRLTQVRSLLEPEAHASRKGMRGPTIALLVGMAGVGLGVGLAKGSADAPPAPPGQPYVAEASRDPAPRPAAAVAPAPGAAMPAASGAPVSPAPPPAPKPAVEQARLQPVSRQPSIPRPAPPPVSAQPVAAKVQPSHDPRSGCEALWGAEQAACLAPAVLAADRQLRHAYATAIDAGVERSIVIDYRKRWARLRKRSSDEPAYLIGSYGALAEDLYRLAEETRASGRSGW